MVPTDHPASGGETEPVGEAGWQLSHGERARLYLARALLQPGDLLILDETLEGLEPRTAQRCLDTATQHATSIVLIHHT